MMELPEITQQPIIHIDGTPNEDYVLRILRAYRQNCDCRWVVISGESPLIDFMNECQDKRAKLLDEAIKVLRDCSVPACKGVVG